MSNKRLFNWCQSILPANYSQIRSQTSQYQKFLCEQLSEGVVDSIQVINVNLEEIIVAVDSATVTNYLRLHSRELQQQIHETFNTNQKLVFKTMPESLLKVEQRAKVREPHPVSNETIDSISSNARWVEDDGLRQALESLANQLKNKARK